MSDHERGAYTPPTADAPLAFDARQPVRGARPIPFTLILSVLVLAALVAAIFVFYRSGVREAGQAPELVGAPVEGMKAPAPAEAQPQDPAAGLQVYRSEAEPMETAPPPQFTEPPEQPQPRLTTPVVVTPPPAPAAQTAPAIRPALPAAPPVQKAAPPPTRRIAPRGEGPMRVAKADPCSVADPGEALVCADRRLAARDRQLQQAYRDAEAAGVPASALRRQQARWIQARAAAARDAPWAVEDVYVARISELNDLSRDAREN